MILLTGGSGTLGRVLRRLLPGSIAPAHQDFDILAPPATLPDGVELIVHCAAWTDVLRAEKEREACHAVNVIGTRNMANFGVPLVYISTEYVFAGRTGFYLEEAAPNPVNWYGQTKHEGEIEAKRAPRWLILRTLFKPRPFPHQRAVTDQWTSGDYVDVIAPKLATAIALFQQERIDGILHVGTGRKSTYDLAAQSIDPVPIRRTDLLPLVLPRDTSLNTDKWNALFK